MDIAKLKSKILNNKFFILIGLLILVIVVTIVTICIISAINNTKREKLSDSAIVIAKEFKEKYTKSLTNEEDVSNLYSDILDNGYNFKGSSYIYYLDKDLATAFNISEDDYAFINSDNDININANKHIDENGPLDGIEITPSTAISVSATVSNSFIAFDGKDNFIVCIFANNNGNYFVDKYKVTGSIKKVLTMNSVTITAQQDTMYACSTGTNSWKTNNNSSNKA